MIPPSSQAFLKELDKKLWTAVDRLRANLDAAGGDRRFIEEHGGKLGNLSVYGQESNPTTWHLAAIPQSGIAIRGIDFNFGTEPANSFTSDQHSDLRADFVMANPPFDISDWWDGKLEGDPRWHHGIPPRGNANFACLEALHYGA